MPTEPNVHGDALCCMVKTGARHKTTETVFTEQFNGATLTRAHYTIIVSNSEKLPSALPSAFEPPL